MSNKSYHFTKQGSHDNQGGETKVMKKILSVALSTAMAFSMFASVAFGAEAEKKLTTQEKYDFLKEEGIFTGYKDGTAGLDKTMTRAEFATVVARLLDLDLNSSTVSYNDKLSGGGVYNTEYWAHGAIEAVTAAGLMQGKNAKAKLFDPNGDVTVEEMAKVLVLALDIEVPAEEPGANWSKHYVAAAVEAGLIPAGSELKAPALRSLLVDASYAAFQAIEDAKLNVKTAEVIDANNVKVTFTDGEVVEVKLEEALQANKETEITVTHPNGKEYKTKVTYVVTAATKIESVSADNFKEVVIKFDGEVDEASAENTANYGLDGFKFESASLSDDKRAVTLLLKNEVESTLEKQKEYELSIKVKNSDGSKTFDQKIKFTPVDLTLPEVKEVVGLGTKAFKVEFSEPVNESSVNTSSNFEIDGKAIAGYVTYSYPKKAIITADLSVGEHKLVVRNVEDFAGNKIAPREITFTVAEDTEAPQIVSVKTKDLTKVEVEFNETVKSVSKAYHTSTYNEAKEIKINDNIVTLEFEDEKKLNLNETTVYLEGVTDYSNNTANREAKVTPALDSTNPVVTSIKAELNEEENVHQFVIEFSKEVNRTDAEKNEYYTLKNEKGELVKGTGLDSKGHPSLKPNLDSNNKKVTIKLLGKLDSGKYTLEIAGIRDRAAIANTLIPYSGTINIGDIESPQVANSWFKQTQVGSKWDTEIFIQFNKDVANDGSGKADDINKYNYNKNYDGQTESGFSPFPKDSKAYLTDGRTVKIVLPRQDNAFIGNGQDLGLRIISVADTKGNFLQGSIAYTAVKDYDNAKVVVKKAEATARDTFKVEFDAILSTVYAKDFTVDGKELKVDKREEDNGKSIVTFKFVDKDAKVNPDPTSTEFVIAAKPQSQTSYGLKVGYGTDASGNDEKVFLRDKIKPELVEEGTYKGLTVASVTNGVYAELEFNKEVTVLNNPDLFTVRVDGKKVDSDKIVSVALKNPVNGASKVVEIKVNLGEAVPAGKLVEVFLEEHNADSRNLRDTHGNAAASFYVSKTLN
ncbi:hypothetical protein PAE9249_00506 [Paenibacillus sp. CECT 9249]|uniref:S-layer homology domain-containing protein n=1 Tax=Paenibacillus sp. CECT 9249 TaxID=2845385 RepID=UPI001E4FB4EF|nr:S-layer homology domain-containing protein [Paenibacillus sp. CECT 9249]CAH0118041.1 hypothetical protein PAE9249_00506 [Paenibacillus sp. CECT 9249]